MARHFKNFLSAYEDYAKDDFCPARFHRWTALSIMAAAIQRKLSLKNGQIYFVPNIYVMLIAHAGVGKSTAIERGTELLEIMRATVWPDFKIIPNQITEAAFIEMMKINEFFSSGKDGKYQTQHSSGFFYASEASASAMQNTHGDFIASLTAFYDCPRVFRKKIKGEKDETEIQNACMNVLAGATFNYLKTLVNETSVMGGFASRVLYVVETKREVRASQWGAESEIDEETRNRLVEDLTHIGRLTGPMKATKDFIELVERMQPEFQQYIIDLKSERMESLMARKLTNTIKVAMLLSIAESDSLIVTAAHLERAKELVEDVTKDNYSVMGSALMGNINDQNGINLIIKNAIGEVGASTPLEHVLSEASKRGVDSVRIKAAIEGLIDMRDISREINGSRVSLKLLVDSKANL